jgi:hypothetical protein
MKKETINLWETRRGEHANEEHTYTATTEELIDLASRWHEEAESFVLDATFYQMGVSTSQWHQQCYAYERRNAICDGFLDQACVSEAIARGEERLRKRWGLSEDEWHVYRNGPGDERDTLIERVQSQVQQEMDSIV